MDRLRGAPEALAFLRDLDFEPPAAVLRRGVLQAERVGRGLHPSFTSAQTKVSLGSLASEHDPDARAPYDAAPDRPAHGGTCPRKAERGDVFPQVWQRLLPPRAERVGQRLLPRHRRQGVEPPLGPGRGGRDRSRADLRRPGRRCCRQAEAGLHGPRLRGHLGRDRRHRHLRRAGRLPLGGPHPVGRPHPRGRPGVRPGQPVGSRAGDAVRLQLRLPRRDRARWEAQEGRRVVNHEYTNENIMFPPTTDPEQVKANKRTAIAAHGLSVVSLKRAKAGDPWRLDPSRRLNRRITGMTEFLVDGPAAGSDLLKTVDDPTGTQGARHLQQLRGRHHPVGHGALGRGELQPVLPGPERPRHHAARTERREQALRPPQHGRPGQQRPRVVGRRAALQRADAGLRERAEPLRLGRRDRPDGPRLDPGQAHRAGSLQARGGEHPDRPERPRRGVLRRRRALRLHLQVHLQGALRRLGLGGRTPAQHDAAERRRPLRRAVHRRLAGRRDRRHRQAPRRRRVRRRGRVDPAGEERRLDGDRHERRRGAGLHAAGGRPRRRRPRWTAPRTSSATRRPARSTSR